MVIDLALDYDNNAGILKVSDNSLALDGAITRGIIRIKEPASRIDLDGTSSPTLNQFLTAGSVIRIPARVDQVVTVEYILLVPITGVEYSNKDSSLVKLNIFNELKDYFYVYTGNKLYSIDKVTSTQHEVILTQPLILPGTELFAAYYKEECISTLYNISRQVKDLVLTSGDCACKTCNDQLDKINKTYMYLEALKLADCNKQEDFLRCLKKLYNITC